MTFQYCFEGSIKKVNNLSVSSPRTWGCFSFPQMTPLCVIVFPTHVGVFLLAVISLSLAGSLPHARGGVSTIKSTISISRMSSPRTWGCFYDSPQDCAEDMVFPTHVGVFLLYFSSHVAAWCLPHARGGVSSLLHKSHEKGKSSPRTWGCFFSLLFPIKLFRVFPTHVGVFLLA